MKNKWVKSKSNEKTSTVDLSSLHRGCWGSGYPKDCDGVMRSGAFDGSE